MERRQTSLVTGGAGFLGSHLCDSLLARGDRVICVDNLITGSEENISGAKRNPRFLFLRADVSEPFALNEPVDAIYHLASPASVVAYQRYPEETAKVNSIGTWNLLKLATQKKASFLYASTSETYGDPKEHPQKETYWGNVNPIGLRACYDEAKRFGEMLTMLFASKYRLRSRVVRIFNTYGPRMQKADGRVISNLVTQSLAGKPLTVYGDGTQTRSFCFVSDMVTGFLACMDSDAAVGEVINLGNPEEYQMLDLAREIKRFLGSGSDIVFKPLPVDDPVKRRPDITKAKRLLGWQPSVSLREGLRETVSFYRSERPGA